MTKQSKAVKKRDVLITIVVDLITVVVITALAVTAIVIDITNILNGYSLLKLISTPLRHMDPIQTLADNPMMIFFYLAIASTTMTIQNVVWLFTAKSTRARSFVRCLIFAGITWWMFALAP